MAKGTQDTNNNKINTFNKGLNKDFDASFIESFISSFKVPEQWNR